MGMAVDTVKKQGAGYNAQRMGKLENEATEPITRVGDAVKRQSCGSPREEAHPGAARPADQREAPDHPGVRER